MMKKTVLILMVSASVLLAGCKKSDAAIAETEVESQSEAVESVSDTEDEEEKDFHRELPKNDSEYFSVNSPEGIKVRDEPGLNSNKITGLPDKANVKLLRKGPEETIDGITSNWLEIELPSEAAANANAKSGWVFGGYMEKSPCDSVPSEYFNYFLFEQRGLASIGSYIKPKEHGLFMYTAASHHSSFVSSIEVNNIGVILRGYPDVDDSECCWYYILNQSTGEKGWVRSKESFYSTGDGFDVSKSEKYYVRKNADALVKKCDVEASLGYLSDIIICSDNVHYIARTNESKNLTIFNRNNDIIKEVPLSSYLNGYNDRESRAICYSAGSNSVFFGWGNSIYRYSITEDNVFPVFEIDTSVREALSSSLVIQEINVSKDERYFYLVAQFNTGRRYISRMIAYDSQTKKQKILDVATPHCDSDHYLGYGNVDFDEHGNAVYHISNSRWNSDYHIVENALVTVSADSENWPNPVLHMLPEENFSDKTYYVPGSADVLCCDSRFCIYGIDETEEESGLRFKESYRFAETSIYDGMRSYNNYQMNEDKSICAVLDGTANKYVSFYSVKTFNLLFALKVDDDVNSFWWNGKMLLLRKNPKRDQYTYSSYDITITEKENQISDNEPLSKEVVGLCAQTFRGPEDGEMGYKFCFSPNGLYVCYNFCAMAESEELEQSVIGAYEITGKNSVWLYPSFSTFRPYYVKEKNIKDFSRFKLLPDQEGIYLEIRIHDPTYNRFGRIQLYNDHKGIIGSTYDWDIGYGNYGVHYEEAASSYQAYGK